MKLIFSLIVTSFMFCISSYADKIDLTIVAEPELPRVVHSGDMLQIEFNIVNTGDVAAFPKKGKLVSKLYLSRDLCLDESDLLLGSGENNLVVLWPLELDNDFFHREEHVSIELKLPEDLVEAGNLGFDAYLLVEIDAEDSVSESDEKNLFQFGPEITVVPSEENGSFRIMGSVDLDYFPRLYSETHGWLSLKSSANGIWVSKESSEEWIFVEIPE